MPWQNISFSEVLWSKFGNHWHIPSNMGGSVTLKQTAANSFIQWYNMQMLHTFKVLCVAQISSLYTDINDSVRHYTNTTESDQRKGFKQVVFS